MRLLIILLATLSAFARRLPREVLLGECYDIKTTPEWDLTKFSSKKWFETQRYHNFFEQDSNCASQVFFLDEVNKKIDISFSFKQLDGSLGLAQGKLNYTKSDSGFSMDVTYPQDSAVSSFAVLATDNEKYSILYSCWQMTTMTPPEKQERLWVLSSTPTMSNETLTIVQEAMKINGTDLGRYCDIISQESCS